jgi:hypothetical protein
LLVDPFSFAGLGLAVRSSFAFALDVSSLSRGADGVAAEIAGDEAPCADGLLNEEAGAEDAGAGCVLGLEAGAASWVTGCALCSLK